MTQAVALSEGEGIFTVNGQEFTVAGFFHGTLFGYRAFKKYGFWYGEYETAERLPAETIRELWANGTFETISRMTRAPTSSEIDAWYRNPDSLRDRFPAVNAYCRTFLMHSPTRDAWIIQQRITRRAIRAAIQRMDDETQRT